MRNNSPPPIDKLRQLEPDLYLATILIVGLGILGGWAGRAWPWILGICVLRLLINLAAVNFNINSANTRPVFIAVALVNYLFTIATVFLADRFPNPFWLLIIVGTVGAALNRSMPGILAYSGSAFAILAFFHLTRGLDRASLASGTILSFLSLIVGLTTNRGLSLLYREHEKREKVEEAVRRSEQRLRQIANNMLDLIAQTDGKGNFSFISPSFQNILGYNPEDLIGRPILDKLHPEDLEQTLQAAGDASRTGEAVRLDLRMQHADGHYVWLECAGNPLMEEGQYAGIIVSGRDITERRRMEMEMQTSLREKEVLLKEIHHRVKNNLQVVCSLLNLQSQKALDQTTRNILRESQDRVRSMALIHEKLYQSENLAEIEFSQYIYNLTAYLVRSYRANAADICLNIQCDPIYLDIDTSMPCGLILNELVSNALKHAFPDGKSGEIWVEMRSAKSHRITLVVADDGIGLPPEVEPLGSSSLGLQLVNTLVDQLGGEIQYDTRQGTRVEISFKPLHQRRAEKNR